MKNRHDWTEDGVPHSVDRRALTHDSWVACLQREILRLAAREKELAERVSNLESVFAREADMRRAAPAIAQGIADRDARIEALAARVADLESVIAERGEGTPAPEMIDEEAFAALSQEERWNHYREVAGWGLLAREHEQEAARLAARVEELESEVEDGLRGQVEISESGGRMYEKLSARIKDLEAVAAPEELKLLRAWESAMLGWFDNDGGYVSVRLNSAEEDAKIAEEEAWSALCAFRERNKQEEKEG